MWSDYVEDVNDRIVLRLQAYTHLIVGIIFYNNTLPREGGEVLYLTGLSLIWIFMISTDLKWS